MIIITFFIVVNLVLVNYDAHRINNVPRPENCLYSVIGGLRQLKADPGCGRKSTVEGTKSGLI
jgi:hypothetical protein